MTTTAARAQIVGMGQAICRVGEEPRRSVLDLQVEAANLALVDAGVLREDVDVLFTGRMPRSYLSLQANQALLSELKLSTTFCSEITNHGAGALGALQLGALALEAGRARYVLCVTGEASPLWIDPVLGSMSWEAELQFEAPFGPSTPALYALSARRYMHEYGVTPEELAVIAVNNRRWALDHPDAAMRHKGEITVEDVLASPMIASPIRMLDSTRWYPGGLASAVVLAMEAPPDAASPPVSLLGWGQSTTHEWVSERMAVSGVAPWGGVPSLVRTGAIVAAAQAYEDAGVSPSDMEFVQTTAPFTFMNAIILEELGICGIGEAGAFVRAGGIDRDGGLPFNTFGGYLSFGQIGQGLYHLKEAVEQLRGDAGPRQVPGCSLGVVHGHGGVLAAHSVVVLGGTQ